MSITLSFDEGKIVVEGADNFEKAKQFVKEVLGECEFEGIKFKDGVWKFSLDFKGEGMFSNIVTCKLTVNKRKGRRNLFFCIEITIDEEFYKEYDPYLPKWSDIPYFKEFEFSKIKRYNWDRGVFDDFHKKIGMTICRGSSPDPDYAHLSELDDIFDHDIRVPKIAMKGNLLWKAHKEYKEEIEKLINIALNAKEEVVKNCLEAYMSPEIKLEKRL